MGSIVIEILKEPCVRDFGLLISENVVLLSFC